MVHPTCVYSSQMFACVDEDRVASYFAGALSDTEVDALEAHVDGCAACRELLDACAAGDDAATPTTRESGDPEIDEPRTFRADELVAERYRIIRFIAAGGMGEVYEADDTELHEHVALKTLRVELTDAPLALERFRREVQLARKITHPNVCRIFDVAKHVEPSGDVVVFMTMALLGGESLAKRIRRDGALPAERVLPIARDLAAALDAAHAAGILHRDFKSDNVQLVPDTGAVVTDFGLARPTIVDRAGVTASTGFVGTPAYMAPEQVKNRALTPATDVYAFGVVLFEMMTGELPFVDTSPLAVAARRLHETPREISELRPELPAAWSAVVRRCLEIDPARRFASAGEAVAALGGERPRSLRKLAIGAALVAAIAAGAFAIATRDTARPAPAVSSLIVTHSVADDPGLGALVEETLVGELAGRRAVVTTSRDEAAQLTVARARIEPRVTRDGELVTLVFAAIDPRSSAGLASAEVTGPVADLPHLVARGVGELAIPLHLPESEEPSNMRVPAHAEARTLYGAALAKSQAGDARHARDGFVATIAAEPEFPWARLALARTDALLGYDTRAKREATAAVAALPESADARTRAWFRAEAAAASRDWDGAFAGRQALAALEPDNATRFVELAHGAAEAKHHDALDAALARVAELRPGDPHIDLLRAQISDDNPSVQAQAAARAAAVAEHIGETELAGRAHLLEARGLFEELELDAATAADRAAADEFTANKVIANRAKAWRHEASILVARGRLDEARRRDEAALADLVDLDRPDETIELYAEMSSLERAAGNLAEAKALHERGAALAETTGSHRTSSVYMMNLGEILFEEGNLAGARALVLQALQLRRNSGPRRLLAATLATLATLENEAADPALPSRKRLDEATTTAKPLASPLDDLALAQLGARLRLADGDLEGSLALSRPALARAQRAGADATQLAALVVAALARGSSDDGLEPALSIVTGAADHASDAAVALTEWQVRRAHDRTRLSTLEAAIADAERAGQIRRALTFALLLAELAPRPRAEIEALAARAHKLGFERIARRATALAI